MSIRTTAPDTTNKCYITTSGGGYNKCIAGNPDNKYKARPTTHFVMPNCVGYVYGRWLEYWGLKATNLPTCNAKDWDNVAKQRGFKIESVPSVGSIAVFEGTTYGHVAFVERIESNGDAYLSESNWGHQYFRNVTVKKANKYNYSSSLKCVGFVTNPSAKTTSTSDDKTTEQTENVATTTTKSSVTTSKSKYSTGNYKVTADKLNVRSGAGSSYSKKKYSQFTISAQTKIKELAGEEVDCYVKGLKFTCSEVSYNSKDGFYWGKTPSGWVALDYCAKI